MTGVTQTFRGTYNGFVVTVAPSRRATHLTLKKVKNEFRLTVPYGYPIVHIEGQLRSMLERFMAKYDVSTTLYHIGDVIECPDVRFELYSQSAKPNHVIVNHGLPLERLGIGSGLDLDSPSVQQFISTVLCKAAASVAPDLILPQARAISQRVGVAPASWSIGRGLKTLGTCTHAREIRLSCALVFLPLDLREFVICHELAHLTEMNHSPRFHALCDHYLSGREKSLAASLRRHPWPILR